MKYINMKFCIPVLLSTLILVLYACGGGKKSRVLISDLDLDAVVSVDLATGDRSIVSDASNGSGPNLDSPYDLALDSGNNRILLTDIDLNAVVSVDLATGDRSIVSDDMVGSGPNLSFPRGLALDSGNN